MHERSQRFAAGLPVWRPRLLWLSTSLNSLCLRRPMRSKPGLRAVRLGGSLAKRRPYKKIRLGSLIDVRKVGDKGQLCCVTVHGEHCVRLPNAPLCAQITEILLELMRLQPCTAELPSPQEEEHSSSGRRSASGRRASCPGSACPSTARAVRNLRRQLSMDILSTPRLLGTPRRNLSHIAARPPRGTPREGSVDLRHHAPLLPPDSRPARSASLPSSPGMKRPPASVPCRRTSFLPEKHMMLYKELQRVREETDSLRRDVAAEQATLTMAALTMATLTMATLTMATLTMATPTMATLTMATLTMATLTMATLTMATLTNTNTLTMATLPPRSGANAH